MAEPDAWAGPPHPRAAPSPRGHEAARDAFLEAFAGGRLAHGWLITGPEGVGKATLAYRIARFLLTRPGPEEGPGLFGPAPVATRLDDPDTHPADRLIAQDAHPDLLSVEPSPDPRTKKPRREIVIDDVRRITDFLHKTPTLGAWRAVVVDGADRMNRNAANALLKSLEEPPARAVLLLVAHVPGRLPETVRSRCRGLDLRPVPDAVVRETLEAALGPDALSPEDQALIAALGAGRPGHALRLALGGAAELHRAVEALLGGLPEVDVVGLHGLADRLEKTPDGTGHDLFATLLLGWIDSMIRGAAGRRRSLGDRALQERLLARVPLRDWVSIRDRIDRLLGEAAGAHLDRRAALLRATALLSEAMRQRAA